VVSPLPLVAFAADGRVSRLEGAALVAWFVVSLAGLARSGRSLLRAEVQRRPRALRGCSPAWGS